MSMYTIGLLGAAAISALLMPKLVKEVKKRQAKKVPIPVRSRE